MEILTTLFESGLLGGIATTFITFLGQLIMINTQKFEKIIDVAIKSQQSDIQIHNEAFSRSGEAGEWVRRIMLFMGFIALLVCPFIFAFFAKIPVAVEMTESVGGYLWGLIPEKLNSSIEYVNGFYLADIWKELMANLISAYIGAGITRKAFILKK